MNTDSQPGSVSERLIAYWERHRGFDANMADLARAAGVSRDTVYRWLRRRSLPKPGKALLIAEWLDRRNAPR